MGGLAFFLSSGKKKNHHQQQYLRTYVRTHARTHVRMYAHPPRPALHRQSTEWECSWPNSLLVGGREKNSSLPPPPNLNLSFNLNLNRVRLPALRSYYGKQSTHLLLLAPLQMQASTHTSAPLPPLALFARSPIKNRLSLLRARTYDKCACTHM